MELLEFAGYVAVIIIAVWGLVFPSGELGGLLGV